MPLFPNPPLGAPLSSDVIVNGGATVPKRGLDRWAVPLPGLVQIVVMGDSVSQGTALSGAYSNGYLDCYTSRLARALGASFGGLRGAGFFGLWRSANVLGLSNSAQEWTFAGTLPTQTSFGSPNNLAPAGNTFIMAAGVGNVATFTPPPSVASRYVKDLSTFANNGTVQGGAGTHTNTFAGAGVLNIGSTAGWPASGVVCVQPISVFGVIANQYSVITYTGVDGVNFTGCTFVTGIDVTLSVGLVVTNANVISSATAAFSATTDLGQTVSSPALPRNASILFVANATNAVLDHLAAAATNTQPLALLGRNVVTGGIAQADLYFVDNAGGGTFSYSTDGGTTWVDVPSTTPAIATLRKVSIVTTLPSGNLKVRGASAAGVAHTMILVGVSLLNTVAPTSGVIVHNCAQDGMTVNATTVGGGQGILSGGASNLCLTLYDNAGVSTHASLQPSLMIILLSNDFDLVANATITLAQYTANYQTLINRFAGYADLLLVNCFEQTARTANAAVQASCRAAVKAVAAANGVAVLDLYDAFAAEGDTGFAACLNDGLMVSFVHPTLEGHADMAGHITRALTRLAL